VRHSPTPASPTTSPWHCVELELDMDDYDFVRRLERRGRTVCLRGPAVTSARRWERIGLPRTIASWVAIRWLFLAGVPAPRLTGLYRQVR
jgi:hypothetical protein